MSLNPKSALVRAILVGGAAACVLDGLDAIIAFKAVLGFDPISIYPFVASGLLGPRAFQGGVATALVGVAVHALIVGLPIAWSAPYYLGARAAGPCRASTPSRGRREQARRQSACAARSSSLCHSAAARFMSAAASVGASVKRPSVLW